MLRDAGERGLLAQFPAVLVGTAKASSLDCRTTPNERERYRADQCVAVLRALDRYNSSAMVVNVDLGHTDPQWVLPYGGTITVDGPKHQITAHY
jgi:muramoyltetrapeptide carboxypeptidase LdcA involved in peptidoglycan recycling